MSSCEPALNQWVPFPLPAATTAQQHGLPRQSGHAFKLLTGAGKYLALTQASPDCETSGAATHTFTPVPASHLVPGVVVRLLLGQAAPADFIQLWASDMLTGAMVQSDLHQRIEGGPNQGLDRLSGSFCRRSEGLGLHLAVASLRISAPVTLDCDIRPMLMLTCGKEVPVAWVIGVVFATGRHCLCFHQNPSFILGSPGLCAELLDRTRKRASRLTPKGAANCRAGSTAPYSWVFLDKTGVLVDNRLVCCSVTLADGSAADVLYPTLPWKPIGAWFGQHYPPELRRAVRTVLGIACLRNTPLSGVGRYDVMLQLLSDFIDAEAFGWHLAHPLALRMWSAVAHLHQAGASPFKHLTELPVCGVTVGSREKGGACWTACGSPIPIYGRVTGGSLQWHALGDAEAARSDRPGDNTFYCEPTNADEHRYAVFACECRLPRNCTSIQHDWLRLGEVGFTYRLVPNVAETLQRWLQQGTRIAILSGDNMCNVRRAVHLCGLQDANWFELTGLELQELHDDTALRQRCLEGNAAGLLCSRVTPQQKARVVQALVPPSSLSLGVGDESNDKEMLRACKHRAAVTQRGEWRHCFSVADAHVEDFGLLATAPDLFRKTCCIS